MNHHFANQEQNDLCNVSTVNATFFFQVLSKKKLQDLVREIDPNEQLDEDVEEVCQKFNADFKVFDVMFCCVTGTKSFPICKQMSHFH